MKRTIFFVHLFNDYSGSPRVFKDAINVHENDSDVKILLTTKHDGFLSDVPFKRITIPYLKAENKFLILLSYLLSQLFTFFIMSYLLIKVRVNNGQSRVIVNALMPFGAYLSSKVFAHTTIAYVHETSIKPKVLKLYLLWVVKFCADKVVYVSSFLKSDVGFNDHLRELVVYNPLRSDFIILDELLEPKIKFNNRLVLFVGSLKEFKGIYNFILLAEMMPDVNFLGAINTSKKEYEKFIRKHHLPNNLKFELRPSNLETLYFKATLLVNLSIPELCLETFGLTIIEGFAKGCPALVPPLGGPVEIINSSCGVMVHSNDIKKINDVIYGIINNYEHWKGMSDAAISQAKLFKYEIYKVKIAEAFYTV